jgi:endogenous inhibitor of DNA gyrase (YacG/DUF329 family)
VTSKPRKVRCPQCGGESIYSPENPWRPFCSERCKQIDLGAWAEEKYTIPGATPTDAQDDPLAEQ